MHQMGITFLATVLIMLIISRIDNNNKTDINGIILSKELFQTSKAFNLAAILVIALLIVIYVTLCKMKQKILVYLICSFFLLCQEEKLIKNAPLQNFNISGITDSMLNIEFLIHPT